MDRGYGGLECQSAVKKKKEGVIKMSQIFMKILNMSMAASYCIAVVMVLRFLFRKQPKILSYLLWSVVLFRLVCPFSITGSFSLMRLDTNMISQENMMRWSGTER